MKYISKHKLSQSIKVSAFFIFYEIHQREREREPERERARERDRKIMRIFEEKEKGFL